MSSLYLPVYLENTKHDIEDLLLASSEGIDVSTTLSISNKYRIQGILSLLVHADVKSLLECFHKSSCAYLYGLLNCSNEAIV